MVEDPLSKKTVVIVFVIFGVFCILLFIIGLNPAFYGNNKKEENVQPVDSRQQRDEMERLQDEERKRKEQEESNKNIVDTKENEQNLDDKDLNNEESNQQDNSNKNVIDETTLLIRERKNKYYANDNSFIKKIKNIEPVLSNLGYSPKDKCYYLVREEEKCFYDGKFEAVFDDSSITFSRELKRENLSSYNSYDDLAYFGKILNNNDLSKNSTIINGMLNKITEGDISSFNIDTNGLYIYVSNSGDYLSYRFRHSLSYDFDLFYPADLNLISNISNKDNSYTIKKYLYDVAISSNKKFFKKYDLPYLFFDSNSNNICKMKYYSKEGYIMESSFCHGGTSNTYYRFSHDMESKRLDDFFEIDVKGEYFTNNYMNIINTVLDHIDNIKLDDRNKQRLIDIMNNKDTYPTLIIPDNNIKVTISHYPENYYKDYVIKFEFE